MNRFIGGMAGVTLICAGVLALTGNDPQWTLLASGLNLCLAALMGED